MSGAQTARIAGRLLTAYTSERALKAEDLRDYGDGVRREVARLAVEHRVAGLVPVDGWSARNGGEMLVAARADALRRHLKTLVALRAVAGAFDAAGIPWLVFKGPVLSEHMYARPDQRSYEDLDLLVPPEHFEAAMLSLEEAGASVLDVNWTMVLDRMKAEVRLVLGPTVIDLHWHLINQRGVRRRFSVDVHGAFHRARSIELAGRVVPTLGSVDTVVHTALHAALAGADRLSWLKDADRCSRTDDLEWDAVVQLVRRSQVELPVAVTLWRARRILGTPVPASVLRAISPPAWSAVLSSVQWMAPLERSVPGRSLSGLVAKAAGESGRRTVFDLVRHSVDVVIGGVGGPTGGHDPASPSSLLHPSGGATARSAYLRAVAAAAVPT